MTQKSEVFEENYQHYVDQIAALDFEVLVEPLGVNLSGQGPEARLTIPLFGQEYTITRSAILGPDGTRANYSACVLLAKYVLLAPPFARLDPEWAALTDLRRNSQFTNVAFLMSETERPLIDRFTGKVDELKAACLAMGGRPSDIGASHDVCMEFDALPRLSLLLLFTDGDDEFPASCSILCQRQAEFYLDPESLIIAAVWLAKKLRGE